MPLAIPLERVGPLPEEQVATVRVTLALPVWDAVLCEGVVRVAVDVTVTVVDVLVAATVVIGPDVFNCALRRVIGLFIGTPGVTGSGM